MVSKTNVLINYFLITLNFIFLILRASIFIALNHPLLIRISIIFSSLNICLILKTYTPSWLIIILFILYLGGIIVIFLYICSLAYNLKISINKKTLTLTFTAPVIVIFLITNPINSLSKKSFLPSILYSHWNITIIIVLTAYLLLLLVIVRSITSKKEGALKTI